MSAVNNPASGTTPYLKSMISCLSKVMDDGYKEDFRATHSGLLSLSTKKMYDTSQVRIVNFFKFEAFKDPNDNAILYIIETNDGSKGTLIEACGDHTDPLIDKFLLGVQ